MKKLVKIITAVLLGCVLLISNTSTSRAFSFGSNSPGTTTLSFWQFWDVDNSDYSIMPYINSFAEENPSVEVEVRKLGWGDAYEVIELAMASNTAPDVLELGSTWIGEFVYNGNLADVSSYVKSVKDKYLNWNMCQLDGKYYAVPWASGSRSLAINHDIFKKAGLDPKKPPKDWNELLKYAKAIKTKVKVPGFYIECSDDTGGYQYFGNFLYSANGALVENKKINGKIKKVSGVASSASKKALKFLSDIKPYSICDNEANATLAFENNKLGMLVIGSYLTGAMIKDGKGVKNWSYEIMPACPDTSKSLAFSGAELLTITEQSQKKGTAFKFIKEMVEGPAALKISSLCGYSIIPSYKGLGNMDVFKNPTDEQAKKVNTFIRIQEQGKTWAPEIHPKIEDIGMRVSKMLDDIFLRNMSIDKATRAAETEINSKYLKQCRVSG